jgi:hypothetical protein
LPQFEPRPRSAFCCARIATLKWRQVSSRLPDTATLLWRVARR